MSASLIRAAFLGGAFAWMALAHGADSPRTLVDLDAGWEFMRGDQAAPPAAATQAPDGWTRVDLPHTFNAADGTTAHPYRGPAWYRRTIDVARPFAGRVYLEFDGAALSTDVW